MTALVARRNDEAYWGGKITWVRLTLKNLPVCDDCLINIHETHGVHGGTMSKARWRRKSGATVTHLCEVHKREWETWSQGQTAIIWGTR